MLLRASEKMNNNKTIQGNPSSVNPSHGQEIVQREVCQTSQTTTTSVCCLNSSQYLALGLEFL